jgi:DoxX-like family
MRCDFRTCSGNSHLLRNECVAAGRPLARLGATTRVLRGAPSEKVGKMSKISWRQISAFALAAFFVAGSLSNIFAPGSIYEEYLRWGYPHWFHFVTGSLELTTAVLLAQARTRPWGSALGCTVMLAALATVTLHGEYGHGVPPLIVATLSIVVGWIAWRRRLPARYDCRHGRSREYPRASVHG